MGQRTSHHPHGVQGGGITTTAQRFARRRIRDAVDNAVSAGLHDESILDYFYVHERLRRWSMAGESDPIASPYWRRGSSPPREA